MAAGKPAAGAVKHATMPTDDSHQVALAVDQPPPLGPFDYPLRTYLWVLGMSILGGIVAYMRALRQNRSRTFRAIEFIGELCTSAFAGILAFWLCEAMNVPKLVEAATIGVAGHMGSSAIQLIEDFLKARVPTRPPTDRS